MKDKCPKCEGSGKHPCKDKKGRMRCQYPMELGCEHATGNVCRIERWVEGKVYRDCSLCHGEGTVNPAELFEVECEECYGTGEWPCNYCEQQDTDCDLSGCRCKPCKGTGWRPMTADEVEEYRKQLGQSLYTLPLFVKWNQEHGHGVPYNGNPVKLREGK